MTEIEICKGKPALVKGAVRDKRTLRTWSLLLWNLGSYSKARNALTRGCAGVGMYFSLGIFEPHFSTVFKPTYWSFILHLSFFQYTYMCNTAFELVFLSSLNGRCSFTRVYRSFILYAFDNIIFSAALVHTKHHRYFFVKWIQCSDIEKEWFSGWLDGSKTVKSEKKTWTCHKKYHTNFNIVLYPVICS